MIDASTKNRMEDLRVNLLRLHKVLLDHERAAYEKVNGPIGSPGRVLSLVMSDPWFDWLHKISQMIVRIDEMLEDEETTSADADEIFGETKVLILPSKGSGNEKETEFIRRYKAVLQKDSGAVLAHANVLKALHDD